MSDVRPAAGTGTPARPDETSTPESRLKGLVHAYFGFIWRSLCHLGIPEGDADDGTQQVFLVASKKLDQIPVGSEKAFLFGTAVHVASHAKRTRARRREVDDEDVLEPHDPKPGPDELLDLARARAILGKALDALEPETRAAFVLFELEQLSRAEVAALLGVPEGTVASRVQRARTEFSAHLKRFEAKPKLPRSGP